jgi:hypothetical protein
VANVDVAFDADHPLLGLPITPGADSRPGRLYRVCPMESVCRR